MLSIDVLNILLIYIVFIDEFIVLLKYNKYINKVGYNVVKIRRHL